MRRSNSSRASKSDRKKREDKVPMPWICPKTEAATPKSLSCSTAKAKRRELVLDKKAGRVSYAVVSTRLHSDLPIDAATFSPLLPLNEPRREVKPVDDLIRAPRLSYNWIVNSWNNSVLSCRLLRKRSRAVISPSARSVGVGTKYSTPEASSFKKMLLWGGASLGLMLCVRHRLFRHFGYFADLSLC